MLRRWLCFVVLFLAVSSDADAQFFKRIRDSLGAAPEVQVQVRHPPRLGLEVSRVAFGPEEGDCAGDFVDALISDFTENGVEVRTRRQIEALLAEQEFSLSGVVDRQHAVELGKILGPTALVFVSVRRCAIEKQSLTNPMKNYATGATTYQYVSRTTAYFRASIQVVDLATAKIDRARTVEKQASAENRSTQGRPEHPSEYTMTDQVLREAAGEVHRWFFPWDEVRTLRFFDNTECNLELAYNLVRGGDLLGGREQSEENVKACETYRTEKPKLAARALYNLGMAEFLLDNYDAALAAFDASLRLHDLDPTTQAITDCRQAKESALALNADQAAGEDSEQVARSGGNEVHREASQAEPSGDGKSLDERLEQLRVLHEKGLISDEVYKQKQAELLKDI